jgi:hypothetical protein
MALAATMGLGLFTRSNQSLSPCSPAALEVFLVLLEHRGQLVVSLDP